MMTAPDSPLATLQPERVRLRVAVEYAIEGDLRYLSHHDELRMLSRALVRARWPLAYSQGFNPLPKLSILLPRPVGTASDSQLATTTLTEHGSLSEWSAQLARVLPAGCRLLRIVALTSRDVPQPRRALFSAPLADADAAAVEPRLTALLDRSELRIARTYGPDKPARELDLRPYIDALYLERDMLHMRLLYDQQRSARPVEVMQELELDTKRYRHLVRLTSVEWDPTLPGPESRPAAQEGIGLGKDNEEDDQETH